MLPEIGATELLVIAAVALIVVGPKDLPLLMRKVGQFMAKLRGMAAEFRASFDEMARQSELDELRKEVEAMRRGQVFQDAAADASHAQVGQVFGEIEQSLAETGAQLHPPMSHQWGESTISTEPPSSPEPEAPKKAPRKRAAKPAAEAEPAPPRPRQRKATEPKAAAEIVTPARKPRAKAGSKSAGAGG